MENLMERLVKCLFGTSDSADARCNNVLYLRELNEEE